ncbi:MAG: DUF503 domain-containing protein [Calditrichaceae bacterium]|nr:DUF503 domain-containing protein [Calditrichaceae bacterium]
MIVGVLSLEIHILNSLSLKDKRMVLNHIKDRIKSKFNVSVAEIDYQDKWQRSLIGIALVTSQKGHAEEVLNKIFHLLDTDEQFEIVQYSIDYK